MSEDTEVLDWTELIDSARKLIELSIIKLEEEKDNA